MRNENIIKLFNIVRENKKVSYIGMSYHDQLKTNEWRYFRLYVWLVKGFKCELCNEYVYNKFQIHHKEYRNGLMAWQYDLKDVMLLCPIHHYKIHRPEIIEKKLNNFKSIKEIYNGRR